MSYTSDLKELQDDIKHNIKNVKGVTKTLNSLNAGYDFDVKFININENGAKNILLNNYGDKLEIVDSDTYKSGRYGYVVYVYCKSKIKKYGIDLEIEELEMKLKGLKRKRVEEIKKEKMLQKKKELLKEIEDLENE